MPNKVKIEVTNEEEDREKELDRDRKRERERERELFHLKSFYNFKKYLILKLKLVIA